jgi:hypothetical protein
MESKKRILNLYKAIIFTFIIAISLVFTADPAAASEAEGTETSNEITFTYNSPDHPWIGDELSQVKQRVDKLYPLIKAIYGEPAFNITVNIEKNPDAFYIGEYMPETKKIVLYNFDRYDVLCHEMIHAFHDEYNLKAGLEEGMTRAVEDEVLKQIPDRYPPGTSNPNEFHQHHYDVFYEALSKEKLGGNVHEDDVNGLVKYELGGYAWAKMYYENPNFFINFNKEYYKACRLDKSIKDSENKIIGITAAVLPTVESTPTHIWFARQGCMDQTPPEGNFIYMRESSYAGNNGIVICCYSRSEDGYVKKNANINISWVIYDCRGQIIYNGQGKTEGNGILFSNYEDRPDYHGRIKIVATTNDFPQSVSDTYITTIPQNGEHGSGVFGALPNTNEGTLSFYYPSDSDSYIASVPVVDGAFNAPELKALQGKIRAVYRDGSGQGFEKSFTKDACDYFLLMAPHKPTGLSAESESGGNILTWEGVENAQTYNIKRSTTLGGEYITIASNVKENYFLDQTCGNSAQYYYRVSSMSAGNESEDSSFIKVEAVEMLKTKLTLISSANPCEPEEPVTYTAKVTVVSDNTDDQNIYPTGKIVFKQDGFDLPSGTIELVNGQATYSFNIVDSIPYEFSAEFQSDSFLGSTDSLIQCNKFATKTTLTIIPVSEDTTLPQNKFMLKAHANTINIFGELYKGKIIFKDGENILSVIEFNSNNNNFKEYEFITPELTPGVHKITAVYEDLDTSYFGTYSTSQDTISIEVEKPPVVDDSAIVSIQDLEVSVYQNTPFQLPENVTANTEKGGTRIVSVSWDPAYTNTSRIGTYTFKGTVDGYVGGVTLTLTVKPEILSIAYYNINAYAFQDTPYKLPVTITANMGDGTKQEVPIQWDNPNVDTSKTGRYTFVGKVEGYSRSNITITLDVNAPIVSINDIQASISKNETYTLPTSVTAKLADGWSMGPLKVTWNISSIDTSTPGVYTYEGTVDGYDKKVILILTIKQETN